MAALTRRLPLGAAAACAGFLLVSAAAAPPGGLHTRLLHSAPEDGDTLATMPAAVRLTFSAEVNPDLADIDLVDAGGGTLSLVARGDSADPAVLLAATPHDAAGAYRVNWRVVSADGHPVRGTFVFHVMSGPAEAPPGGHVEPPPPVTTAAVPPGAAVIRGLAAGILAAAAGLLLLGAWVTPGAPPLVERVAAILALAAPVAVGAHVLAWYDRLDVPVRAALATTSGIAEALRLGLALLVPWALWLARRPKLAAILAMAALVAGAGAGHAASVSPAVAIPLKAAHLAAMGLWLGGLLVLVVGVARLPAGQVRRISNVALVSVVVLLLTGVVQTLLLVPDPGRLLRSTWGALIGGKAGGLLLLVAFGAVNRRVLLPRALSGDSGGLRRSAAVETGVMILVIVVAGFLASLPPPPPGDALAVTLAP